MLATETRVQVSILGYLFSDLKEGVGCRVWGVGCREGNLFHLWG
ncbi:hypothetical protein N0824_03679 [Microcystis sp. 0824]|nr:hypothetical protein N0824_03679 [Microcystis sp. 0824]